MSQATQCLAVNTPQTTVPSSSLLGWPVWTVIVVAGLYLPTLNTRFDFIDDGNLVYPAGPMPLPERFELVWTKVVANYHDLGPFRPVLWIHWELQAEAFHGNTLAWRSWRLLWTGFTAAMLLWLLCELGFRPLAAAITTALALWNPFRGEVWTSLTLAEGVAMPYAMLALVCAIRGARAARRAGLWDIGGVLCVLAALGCKNTFAALVPAQVFLRMAPDGRDFLAAWRQRGWRACLLAVTLLMPLTHFIVFKLNWRPGNYETGGFAARQLLDMLSGIRGALNLDFIGVGLLLAVIVVAAAGRLGDVYRNYRGAFLAGLLLLIMGVGIYLPIRGVVGRYTMPAVWGADFLVAGLLSTLQTLPGSRGKRLAMAGIGCGLAALVVANIGRQEKFAARAEMLWNALEYIEQQAPPGATIAWITDPTLDPSEGVHLQWHLAARGRPDIKVQFMDASGQLQFIDGRAKLHQQLELPGTGRTSPEWQIRANLGDQQSGEVLREFATNYHWGHKRFECYLVKG